MRPNLKICKLNTFFGWIIVIVDVWKSSKQEGSKLLQVDE